MERFNQSMLRRKRSHGMETSPSIFFKSRKYADGSEIECVETSDGVFHVVARLESQEQQGVIDAWSALIYFACGQRLAAVDKMIDALRLQTRRGAMRVTAR
jgi:hypothetical protein